MVLPAVKWQSLLLYHLVDVYIVNIGSNSAVSDISQRFHVWNSIWGKNCFRLPRKVPLCKWTCSRSRTGECITFNIIIFMIYRSMCVCCQQYKLLTYRSAVFPFSFLLREQRQPGLDIIICSSPWV